MIINFNNSDFHSQALLDSGAEASFLDAKLAESWGIPAEPLTKSLSAWTLKGQHMALINHRTPPVSLFVSGNNHEEIEFYILHSSFSPIILGHDWLVKHNPHIDWQNRVVLSWKPSCHVSCLGPAFSGSVLYFRLLLLISRGCRRNILICIRFPVKSEPPHYLLTDRTIALLSFSQALLRLKVEFIPFLNLRERLWISTLMKL